MLYKNLPLPASVCASQCVRSLGAEFGRGACVL